MEERVVIKGTPQKNKIAQIITIVGVALMFVSILVASYVFNNEVTDAETGEVSTVTYEYEVEVPYNYYILNVSLQSEDMARLIAYLLTDEQFDAYLVYMQTKGNRPDLFP